MMTDGDVAGKSPWLSALGNQMRAGRGCSLVIILVALCVTMAGAADTTLLRNGMAPPSVILRSLSGGQTIIPDNLRGNVAIIHFWAAQCDSCTREMPAIDRIYKAYSRRGVAVAAVNVGQKQGMVRSFVNDLHLVMPVYLDEAKQAANRYEVVAVPRTYILDRRGVIRYKILGPAGEETLKKLVNSLL